MTKEGVLLIIRTINLETISDVKQFVNTVSKCDFEADLIQDRYTVDAKSIMGIFSLDLSQNLTIHIYSEDCEDFLKEIEKFLVE